MSAFDAEREILTGQIEHYEKELQSLNAIVYGLSLPHGACEPIERKACTHCAALRRLTELAAQYPVTITTAKSIACRPGSSTDGK